MLVGKHVQMGISVNKSCQDLLQQNIYIGAKVYAVAVVSCLYIFRVGIYSLHDLSYQLLTNIIILEHYLSSFVT